MSKSSRRGARWLVLGIALLFCSGCVKRHVQGETIVYSLEPWVIGVTAVAALTVVALGWTVRRRWKPVGYALMGGGVLVLGTTVPGLALSRTVVGPDHFEWWRGIKHTSLRFDELGEVVHSIERVPVGRKKQDVHYFDFKKKNGEVIHVQVEPGTDRFFLDATPEIVRRAREKGAVITEPQRE